MRRTFILLAFHFSFLLLHTTSSIHAQQSSQHDSCRVRVLYFHASMRCQSCLMIEQYAAETMHTVFAKDLRAGKIRWQAINYEDSLNEHFVGRYNLENQALIVSKQRGGKEIEWKLLDKVWELLGEKKKFAKYVSKEVRKWL